MKVLCILLSVAFASGFYIDNNGTHEEKIVGGYPVRIQELPYQASVLWFRKNNICGATIIHASWIITAAHCVANKSNIIVRTGSGLRSILGNEHTVERIIVHADFQTIRKNNNDIALIMNFNTTMAFPQQQQNAADECSTSYTCNVEEFKTPINIAPTYSDVSESLHPRAIVEMDNLFLDNYPQVLQMFDPLISETYEVQPCSEHFIDGFLDTSSNLQEPIQFNDKEARVELPKPHDIPREGELMRISGFGSTGLHLRESHVLMATYVPVVSEEDCRRVYRSEPLTDNMFCAGNGNTDACFGDSGGPGVIHGKLYGIISSGIQCRITTLPGVYTSVNKYYYWIREKTGLIF